MDNFKRDGRLDDNNEPQPDDYLYISVEKGGILTVTTNGFYINHQGDWTSGGPFRMFRAKLPARGARFVCVDLAELNLERIDK